MDNEIIIQDQGDDTMLQPNVPQTPSLPGSLPVTGMQTVEQRIQSLEQIVYNHKHKTFDKTPGLSIDDFITFPGISTEFLDGTGSFSTIPKANVQVFSTPGSFSAGYTVPTGAKMLHVHMFGAGAGAGSGRRSTTNATNSGGGAGGGGSYAFKALTPDALGGSTASIVVGAGGAGGAIKTTDGDGNNGSPGGASSFGQAGGSILFCVAPGGSPGTGGQNGASIPGAGGIIGFGDITIAGGDGATRGGTGIDTANLISPRGGGGGCVSGNQSGQKGGSFITNFVSSGNNTGGAAVGNGAAGNPGTAGADAFNYMIAGGEGGGSGSSNGFHASAGLNGGAGSNGGFPGGGAGGGGGADSTSNTQSGAGGTGGNGLVIVIAYA